MGLFEDFAIPGGVVGGWRSGRAGWKPKVGDFLRLSIFDLMRELKRRGISLDDSYKLSIPAAPETGGPSSEVRIEFGRRGFMDEAPWWVCPRCARRVAILYLGTSGWRCRVCLGAAYESTCEDPIRRAERRYRKVLRQLEVENPSVADDIPPRPPGMHRATYSRLVAKAQAALEERENYYFPRFARAVGLR